MLSRPLRRFDRAGALRVRPEDRVLVWPALFNEHFVRLLFCHGKPILHVGRLGLWQGNRRASAVRTRARVPMDHPSADVLMVGDLYDATCRRIGCSTRDSRYPQIPVLPTGHRFR